MNSGKRKFFISLFVAMMAAPALAQSVTVPDQKEAVRLYRQSIIDGKNNRLYFDEIDRCRTHNREKRYPQAIDSCRRAIDLAQRLPADRILERQSGYIQAGIAYLRQSRSDLAASFFEKGLEVGRQLLDDSDSETGEIYFLIGQAHHVGGQVEKAIVFYEKAESSMRAAFAAIGEDHDEFRSHYPIVISYILDAHLSLLSNTKNVLGAAALQERIDEFQKEFANYLKD
jgi:tetratricopeptide (TPR) repeat protein